MLIEKHDSDDESRRSVASGHTWSPVDGACRSDLFDSDAASESMASAPACLNRAGGGIEGLDSHQYPPFVSAVPVDDGHLKHENDRFPAPPVPRIFEVDADTGTIRVEMEDDASENNPGTTSNGKKNNRVPISNLTRYQRCWLIVFVRKWARRAGTYSGASTARKYSPKMKRVGNRSAAALKNVSTRSASFVRTQSIHCKNRAVAFSQKHRVEDKARTSVKNLGQGIQKASKATVKGVKQASVATAKGIKGLEEKHHIVRKSKHGLKKSGAMVRNAWNGKPLRTGSPVPGGSSSVHSQSEPVIATGIEGEGASLKVPRPSSE